MKLSEMAESLGPGLGGDGSLEIDRAVHPAEAEAPCDLALAMDRTMLGLLGDSAARAAVVFEGAEIPEDRFDGLVFVPRPRYAMAGLMRLFERPVHAYDGIHPSAVVESDATLGEGVSVGACAYVRSEEHTSELQSLMRISYAVVCLKKKKTDDNTQKYI